MDTVSTDYVEDLIFHNFVYNFPILCILDNLTYSFYTFCFHPCKYKFLP